MAKIPTIAVWHSKAGFQVINESDFDPKVHKRHDDKAQPDPEPQAEGEPVAEGGHEVVQSGAWWIVQDQDGQRVGKAHRGEDDARAVLRELISDG